MEHLGGRWCVLCAALGRAEAEATSCPLHPCAAGSAQPKPNLPTGFPGTWEVSGSLQPAGALVEAAEGPSCEARRGGRVPVVYNLAQGCHEQVGSRVRLDAPRVASDKKVQVPFDIQAGR